MPRLEVSIEKRKDLRRRMRKLKVFEKDLVETFVRSSGPGGQNVNKVSSCVVLKHLPTGTQVKCQEERTQGLNRFLARTLMIEKLDKQRREARLKIVNKIEKLRRQTRKKSKSAKEAMLKEKQKKSEKKKSRVKIKPFRLDSYI